MPQLNLNVATRLTDEPIVEESIASVKHQILHWKTLAERRKAYLRTATDEISALRATHQAELENVHAEATTLRNNHNVQIAEIFRIFTALKSEHEHALQKTECEKKQLRLELQISLKKNKQLMDLLECDICNQDITQPFTLKECGHTFCHPCLSQWFATTHARFLGENPIYNPTLRIEKLDLATALRLVQTLAIENAPMAHQITLRDVLPAALARHPHYTCPLCRKQVQSQPIEVYTLKAVASLLGERVAFDGQASGQWEGFFD